MTDGDHGEDHSHVGGDGEHATGRVPDSERGHDHDVEGAVVDADQDDLHADQDDHHAGDASSVSAAVVTVSSTRSLEDDESGDAVVELLEADGHAVATRELVNDDYDGLQGRVASLSKRDDVDVVVMTGGTGVTPDDVTPDAVEPLFSKHLPGFGEEFRRRSVDEVGPMGLVSRATAGVVHGTLVAVLPGSESAARTGTELLTSVVSHLVGLASDGDDAQDEAGDGDEAENGAGDPDGGSGEEGSGE